MQESRGPTPFHTKIFNFFGWRGEESELLSGFYFLLSL